MGNICCQPMVPGALPLYDKAKIWTADDDQGFSFDIDHGIVFWKHQRVDMMRICDKCLSDVHRAAVSDTRYAYIFT